MDKKRTERIAGSLKAHREDFDDHYAEIEKFMSPRRGLFSGSDPASQELTKRGKRVNSALLNSTPNRALRILKSGMQAGVTSQSRPWFTLQHDDPDLRKRPAVKEYTNKLLQEARIMLAKSGMYNALHSCWGDLGAYGTESTLIEDDELLGIRPMQLVPGSYWLGASDKNRIDTLYREFQMTVNQIVGKFVYGGQRFATSPDWSKVPTHVKQSFDKGDIGHMLKVSHLVTPRHSSDRDPRQMNGKNKPIASMYWMDDQKHDELMGDLGYDRNPISASRWEVQGFEVYGRSPGMDALPDCKELMSKRRDYAEMLRRVNRPPMNAHSDLRNSAFSMMPGAVNFMADPSKGLQPAFQVTPQFGELRQDTEQTKDDIWSAMYADLFMMISSLDRRQITATEIDERREEKLLGLGPVLERSQFEKLEPLVSLCVERVIEMGRVPPPPAELEGEELNVQFIGMLAQAQKAVATGAIERVWGFAGNLAGIKPEVMDKLDADKTIDEYADMLGVPPEIVKSTEEATTVREQRAEMEQAMQMAEQAPNIAGAVKQSAEAARLVSEADNPRGAAPGDVLAKAGLR
jgi:hypothetical protein